MTQSKDTTIYWYLSWLPAAFNALLRSFSSHLNPIQVVNIIKLNHLRSEMKDNNKKIDWVFIKYVNKTN